MERWAGVLGDAIKPAERYQLEQNKINKALLEYGENSEQANKIQEAGNRALTLLNAQQKIQADNVRERLLLLSEEAIVHNKLAQAKLDAEKAGLRDIDLTKAEIVFRKQAKEAIEQQAASLSKLPESVRSAQQAMDKFKQLDQFLVTTASSFENAFADIATSSKTAAEAFKALADSIIKDLIRITIRMSVTGPLLRSLGGLFGSGGDLSGSNNAGWLAPLSSGSFLPTRQAGGSVTAGKGYIVGEHGMELFVPRSQGQIVPGSLQKSGGGSSEVIINNYTAADTETKQTQQQGPNGERIVIDIVKKAQQRGEFDGVNRGRFAMRPAKVR
jgi:Lambda phage tail tape-measure protein (Tape_meas_lam_C)